MVVTVANGAGAFGFTGAPPGVGTMLLAGFSKIYHFARARRRSRA